MIKIFDGGLDVKEILSSWHNEEKLHNNGAFVSFVGIVRAENNIDGLSFDIYEPLLYKWFANWQQIAQNNEAKILMAHSNGNVGVYESSFIACVVSSHRKSALKIINDFVEDFKANAPIWKYDLKNNTRIYTKDRSKAILGCGLLA